MESDRHNPFISKLLERKLLNLEGSSKKTYHISLACHPELTFQPGDSIAVFPHYKKEQITPLLDLLNTNGLFSYRGEIHPLSFILAQKANIDSFTNKLLRAIATHDISHRALIETLLNDKDQSKAFIQEHTVESALNLFEPKFIDVQMIVDSLSPILPRMYSIASSKHQYPNEIHLTVATFSFVKQGKLYAGLGSNFLCHAASIDQTPIPFYIHHAEHFRLPKDPHIPIIMIGPGTGIAPYRAFLQERSHFRSTGNHWLFFGDRNRQSDFYYEDFFTDFKKTHLLKLSLAFSRDQPQKIYVQDRMLEEARELWQWIQNGAHIYICGDAHRMAKDVQETLKQIAQIEGGLSEESALDYLKQLRKSKQLLLDIY
ncbi:MAG: sulfite reductase [Simkaniaceae bacterium]|nr:sulfite reductase [Simkaniaceae bacterium]MCF7852283.1 sulfite reductase [Simkaniaceae bacterium]